MLETSSPLRIGFLAPLSGSQAIVGVPMARLVCLAVEEMSRYYQLPHSVELVTGDDEASETRARELAATLVDDGQLVAVVGHKNTGPSQAAGELYEAAGLTQLTASATGSALGTAGRKTFFRLCSTDRAQGALAADFVCQELGKESALIVHDGTAYGLSLARAFAQAAAQHGSFTSWQLELEPGHPRYPQVGAALERCAAAVVYLALTEIEGALVARELRAGGYCLPRVGADGSRQSKFPELAGEAAEGAYMTYAGVDGQATAAGRELADRYYQRHQEELPVYAVELYDAVTAVFRGLAALGSPLPPPRGALARALHQLAPWPGMSGTVEFDAQGERVGLAPTLWVVRQGTPVLWSLPA